MRREKAETKEWEENGDGGENFVMMERFCATNKTLMKNEAKPPQNGGNYFFGPRLIQKIETRV